jgi:hypothetical protein
MKPVKTVWRVQSVIPTVSAIGVGSMNLYRERSYARPVMSRALIICRIVRRSSRHGKEIITEYSGEERFNGKHRGYV